MIVINLATYSEWTFRLFSKFLLVSKLFLQSGVLIISSITYGISLIQLSNSFSLIHEESAFIDRRIFPLWVTQHIPNPVGKHYSKF